MLSKSIKQSVMGFVNSFCMSFVLFFQLILSSCVSFICWFVMITFIVLLPLRLVCSAVFLSSTRQVHFSATSRHRRHLLDSIFHSLHVSIVFSSLLFLILLLVCPSLFLGQQCSQPQPSFQSPVLIPHSSICPPLNCHYSFLLPFLHPYQSNLTLSKRSLFLTRYLITLLLLLSGNVELTQVLL